VTVNRQTEKKTETWEAGFARSRKKKGKKVHFGGGKKKKKRKKGEGEDPDPSMKGEGPKNSSEEGKKERGETFVTGEKKKKRGILLFSVVERGEGR